MKNKIIVFVIALLIILLVACVSASEPQVTGPSATTKPPPTSTSTPTLESTLTPTVAPSPTPVLCDASTLREAISNLNLLQSYKSNVEILGFEDTTELISIQMDMTASFNAGDMEALDVSMQFSSQEQSDFHMILVGDSFYFREPPEESWRVLEGNIGNMMLQRLTDSQYLKPELIDRLEEASCTASLEEIEGELAQVYSYSDVKVDNIANLSGNTLGDLDAEVSPATVAIVLFPIDEIVIPIKFLMLFKVTEPDLDLKMMLSQEYDDINKPVVIQAPEEAGPPTFFLEIPLPEDADVSIESESLIAFTTLMPPDEALDVYTSYLKETGWIHSDSYTQEVQNVLFEVAEFSSEEQSITVAIAVRSAYTIVSIAGETGPPTADFNLPFEMRPFITESYGFVLEIPSEWADAVGIDERCGTTQVCFVSTNDQVLIINEADLGDVGGQGMMTISEYVDVIMPTFGEDAPGYEFLSREQLENNIGQDSEIITYTLYDGAVKVKMLWFAKDGKAINVYYMGFEDVFEEMERAVEWSFKSLRESGD